MTTLGIVVIGRNEAQRLPGCFDAIGTNHPIVYVDSASQDNSCEIAKSRNILLVELDRSAPFTAARGRNAGLAKLRESHPDLQFVQFVDGDSDLAPTWLAAGMHELQTRPDLAAVCGILREKFPTRSLYNRLCDVEWAAPVGEIKSCGGIAMYRISSFLAVGGFNPNIPAGEEPELCMRLRNNNWKIARLPTPMAKHDANMLHFSQWWNRTIRGGFGAMDVTLRKAPNAQQHYLRSVLSSWIWALGWPLLFLLAIALGYHFANTPGLLIAAALLLALPLIQVARISAKARRRTDNWTSALVYGLFTFFAKWPHMLGHFRCLATHLFERPAPTMNVKAHKPA